MKAVSTETAFLLILNMPYSYLALGDSYTIGEQVLLVDSFPYQLVQMLRKKNVEIFAPEIIAKTGWTTDELNVAIDNTTLLPQYDFVTLLVGVNNQYRGRTVEEYEIQFTEILLKAIAFAGNNPKQVFVLSIPDWGVTPFAKERDTATIAEHIREYNTTCKKITDNFHCHFIDITTGQIADAANTEMMAVDGLHPSGKEYGKWATKLADIILEQHSV